MVYDKEARKNGWTISETKPGYASKTFVFKVDNSTVTATVNRPILTPEEQKKREEQVAWELSYALRDYVFRKEREKNKLPGQDCI